MESLTKRRVTETELDTLVRRGFGPDARIAQWRELTEGHYNVAYAIRLADGADLILKIAPPPGLKLLSHEVDLMRTEVDFFRRAGAAGVAVPEVVFADTERDLVGSDFVFLSRIDGAGDPVAEFVALTLFRDPAELPDLLAGYAGAGHGTIELTRAVERRLSMYRVYLYLIMLVEGATRGWRGPEREAFERRLAELLTGQLDQLG